ASTVDGPGFRTTVFFKGCNLCCQWCHNPEGQAFSPEEMHFPDRTTTAGRLYSAGEVMEIVLKDRRFYETSGGGVTFSGGECMLQTDFLETLLRQCKTAGIHTAVDTAGDVPFSVFQRILPFTDLFLYDLKLMDPEKHRHYTGAGNERILSNLAELLKRNMHIFVRIPIVPGVNDTGEEMRKVRSFFDANGWPEKVELLPYHRMGVHKDEALGREPHVFEVPGGDEIGRLMGMLHPE
ncbi:MAG: glycyl-radical enzyme activating protein, partial [Lachnospiraceae bacterium]|nr:glycyl-radical enzyme activating protein [Lachnospiraceae bacterium]